MTRLKVVFNRERSVLSWQKFDCYKNAAVADGPDASPSPSLDPSPAPAPTTLMPQQDATNRYPGTAPVPRSAASRSTAGALLLPLLAAAAALV